MKVTSMSKEDFKNVPWLEETDFVPVKDSFKSIVIIPTDEVHDSGYLCMTFALVDREQEPICKVAGGSDVLHLDGIGGYGEHMLSCKRDEKGKPVIDVKGWSIDCLPCGYLRLFARSDLRLERTYEFACSSFEIFAD